MLYTKYLKKKIKMKNKKKRIESKNNKITVQLVERYNLQKTTLTWNDLNICDNDDRYMIFFS